ncbi:peroxidase family protein [Medicago truncatula]|uniref:peroxidase n=1 Tax=Medicago truncatula TaxID=3880 RepID=A0A072VMM2_MEDTR|nr:peroxidase family protein [Medicago truncatula]
MVLLSFVVICQGGILGKNFYQHSCPQANDIIMEKTLQYVSANPNLPAKVLRLHFHDYFVKVNPYTKTFMQSFLFNSTSNNTAEKDAIPNLTLAGFDVINDIKNAVEEKCAKTVSCADILALAARDADIVTGSLAILADSYLIKCKAAANNLGFCKR